MSIIWSNLLLLLLLLLFCCCCWARPKCPCPASHNEVNSREVAAAEEEIPNDLLLRARGYYKPLRSYYATSQFSGSPFLKRVFNAPALRYPDLNRFDVPDGDNYVSNDILPLSTYELFEPDSMY